MHAERRDQRVTAEGVSEPRDLTDRSGEVRACVEHPVPPPAAQPIEVAVTVSVHVIDVGEVGRLGGSPMEDGDLVAATRGLLDEGAPHELSPTDHQELHPANSSAA
jgi:hypothetical protein